MNYIDENVRPRAEEALRSRYQESDADAKGRVEALLRHLGDRTNFLTNSKLESGTPELSVRQKDAALQIVSELQRHGHQAVLVGGCVRDELVGRSPKDYDIATSARPEEVLSLFASSERTGSKSGPVRVFANNLPCEVSTFRSESKDGKNYLNADSDALALDAARRDLTITAMSRDPVSGKIYDFFGGQKDIENRTIRAVGDPEVRVSEDPFRMLRAVRMAAELGFQLEPKLEEAIKRNAYRINGIRYDAQQERNAFKDRENSVPGDKVRDELLKILGSKNPVLGLDLLMETGLMREILPEVADTNTERGEQDPRWHPEGNTWVHTRAVLEIMSRNGADAELMLAGLLHDIGKPRTQERYADGRITNKLHAEVGADMAYGIVRRFDMSQARTNRLATIVRMHMLMHQGDQLRQGRLGALLENPYIDDLILLQDADAQVGSPVGGRGSLKSFFTRKREEFTARANETARLDAPPLVTGRMLVELGHKPGPEFKRMLAEAREHQIEGVFQTEDEARAWARKHFSAR